jgi:hypothetical protein
MTGLFAAAAELGKQSFDFFKHDHPDAIECVASKSKGVLEPVNRKTGMWIGF